MGNRYDKLSELGWSDWFEGRAGGGPEETVARVAAVDRDRLLLVDETGQFPGRLAGRYLHHHHRAEEMPCVGDWVTLSKEPDGGFGVIRGLLERRTSLRRKAAGNVTEQQMIAANVDFVVVVQACDYDFNLKRLERYLVMVLDGGAEPFILLTKTDLVDPAVLEVQRGDLRDAGITAPIIALSNVTQEGVDDFQRALVPGKTYSFVGSSGVGKSTLINRLLGREVLETRVVSGTGEGRHTTTRRELIRLEDGALVIDNPGMREFGILDAEAGLGSSYSDVADLASGCRFRNCTHTGEPGCAVREAVGSGEVSQGHFDNYLKLRKEAEFYEMSAAEKRKKDRDFGKFIKSAKRDLKKGRRRH
ncbi:MAG: ribosome small subunit-dependent GTPase A [Planctomycetota bacterium]